MSILAFLVSFLASTAGAICGIGGGVIIKPTLDLFQMASVSTISFLSGCTVLSMSLYSVGRGLLAHDSTVDFKTGTPLALGAAIGGVSANNCLLPSRKPLPTRIWWGCTGRMSRNHHNLYACLYGKQSAYKNASDSRVNSLCDNRRGTWYHVKLFGNRRRAD